MEVDEIQTPHPVCKYSRVNSNGTRIDCSKIGVGGGGSGGGPSSIRDDEYKIDVVSRTGPATTSTTPTSAVALNGGIGGGGEVVGSNRFGRQWQHSSRIIRVSRASGGKDRHSKVWTAKGPRDRRIRLSVTTAIQFYDLQDRLGYDQPSKAVEWLIKAAADSINELPCLNSSNFPPETPRQLSDERRSGNVVDSADVELDMDPNSNFNQQQQQMGGSMSMSKSGCSSNNSEGSKGSGLSLSRSEIRVKARERARERTAKEKDKESEPARVSVAPHQHHQQQQQQHNNVSSVSQTSSFTQLLTGGFNNLNDSNAAGSSSPSPHHGSARATNTSNLQWLSSSCTTPMADYFGTGLMGSRTNHSMQQIGNTSLPQVMTLSSFNIGGSENNHNHHQHQQHHSHELQLHTHHHNHQQQQQQQQHFPFLADQHMIQIPNTGAGAGAGASGNDYNLNFSMSSSSTTFGLAPGFNRGTLQSNSPSLLNYLQRFSATDGTSVPFFLGGAAISSAAPAVDNQHHHHHHQDNQQFHPPGLQLCYGDGGRHSDQEGKGKS